MTDQERKKLQIEQETGQIYMLKQIFLRKFTNTTWKKI